MEKSNLQLLLALAAVIIIYLIMNPYCPPDITNGLEKNSRKDKLDIFKNALGIQGSVRRMLPREDSQRKTILVGIKEDCPSGFTMAPVGYNLSRGGCHVTCGGGHQCGDKDGNDPSGVPVPQKCCQEDIS
tara:strand:- start:16394 stop:16783 length:390 start_codon:yes stop_codon:yes gene_type:complete